MHRLPFAICTALAISSVAWGQAGLVSRPPLVRLSLPPGVPSESVQIMYLLYGPFGAEGRILRVEKDQPVVEISPLKSGIRATDIKVAAYLPGCEVLKLEIPLEGDPVVEDLHCNAIGTKRLHGRIANLSAIEGATAQVEITFSTKWICQFFQLADCMTPIIPIATAGLRDGEFTVDLPEFSRQANLDGDGFNFAVNQPARRRTATLTPVDGSTQSSGMMLPLTFEPDVKFVAVEFRVEGEIEPSSP